MEFNLCRQFKVSKTRNSESELFASFSHDFQAISTFKKLNQFRKTPMEKTLSFACFSSETLFVLFIVFAHNSARWVENLEFEEIVTVSLKPALDFERSEK